uniref:NADP-dependent oxidoreductase domain-containing protein n=1 Tax=Chromulina nebulosa TaxID=96789 RepID=A0A7S0ST34_9STRA|mmetsp:Transcript_2266/g.2025  ORF Transcript_2266/g.2025 Transcript_2266/m.2025 type:complete len:317 (+) Transcript_2266:64-1014(+)
MTSIPPIGLGTWKIPKNEAEDIVYKAIVEAGVRHIDCACDYGNEVEVGKGIKKAINEGFVTRENLWITSKLWNTYHHKEHVELAIKKSLSDLQLNYLDLYLIHFPICLKYVPFEDRYPPEWVYDVNEGVIVQDPVPISETWSSMEQLVHKELTKYIGVCNFNVQSLTDLLSYANIKPYINQIEVHPLLTQHKLIDFCYNNNIKVTSFSPLGSLSYIELNMDSGLGKGLLQNPIITGIAESKKKSPAQVILRWHIQRGLIPIPKSTKIERIKENFNIHDFNLSDEEFTLISSLNIGKRFNDPGEFCKSMGGSIPIYD